MHETKFYLKISIGKIQSQNFSLANILLFQTTYKFYTEKCFQHHYFCNFSLEADLFYSNNLTPNKNAIIFKTRLVCNICLIAFLETIMKNHPIKRTVVI